MVAISQVIKMKERGHSNREIAEKFNVTPRAIDKALVKAKKDGLWNGTSGTNKYFENGTNEHPFTIETIMRKEKREVLKDGSLKPKPFPQYRCLKCMKALSPLDEVYFTKGKDQLREQLISQGYTHICPKCLIAYERTKKPPGEVGNCPICGEQLDVCSHKGQLINVLWCSKCERPFQANEKDLEKIQKFAEKTEKQNPVTPMLARKVAPKKLKAGVEYEK